ncbi:hypothetical protein CEV33_1144 [Brucella grignonensis]|uniref:Uncharacterized protein n=1 Tax=Brucella grignonensis TaxID=94627 RepID=A0A256FC97_9HYPH|nr:hypothetical protein CEV33_1144 [Brucella grignonensis]
MMGNDVFRFVQDARLVVRWMRVFLINSTLPQYEGIKKHQNLYMNVEIRENGQIFCQFRC